MPMTPGTLEAAQGAPRDPRRDSRGERSPWLPLETRPDSPRDGVSREVPCSTLKGETVPDSLPATPKSPPTRRVPPRGTPRVPAPLPLSPFSPPDRLLQCRQTLYRHVEHEDRAPLCRGRESGLPPPTGHGQQGPCVPGDGRPLALGRGMGRPGPRQAAWEQGLGPGLWL